MKEKLIREGLLNPGFAINTNCTGDGLEPPCLTGSSFPPNYAVQDASRKEHIRSEANLPEELFPENKPSLEVGFPDSKLPTTDLPNNSDTGSKSSQDSEEFWGDVNKRFALLRADSPSVVTSQNKRGMTSDYGARCPSTGSPASMLQVPRDRSTVTSQTNSRPDASCDYDRNEHEVGEDAIEEKKLERKEKRERVRIKKVRLKKR